MTRHGEQRQVEPGVPPSIPNQSIEGSGQEATLAFIPPTQPGAGAIRISAAELHTEGRMSQRITDFLRQYPGAESFTIGRGNASTIITDSSIQTISRSHLFVRVGEHDALYVTNTGTQENNAYYQNPEDPIKTELPKGVEVQLRPDTLIFLGQAKPFVIDPAARWKSISRPGHLDLTEARMALADLYLDSGLRDALENTGDKITIGRLGSSKPLAGSNLSKISLEHLQIERIAGGYAVTDLSESGTWISADKGRTYFRLPKGHAIEVDSASLVLGGCKKCYLPAVERVLEPGSTLPPASVVLRDPDIVAARIIVALAESRRIIICGREFYSVRPGGGPEVPKDIVVFELDSSRFTAEITPTRVGMFLKKDGWEVRNLRPENAAPLNLTENGKTQIVPAGKSVDVLPGTLVFLSPSASPIRLPGYNMK
jgi:hypothetical protein